MASKIVSIFSISVWLYMGSGGGGGEGNSTPTKVTAIEMQFEKHRFYLLQFTYLCDK